MPDPPLLHFRYHPDPVATGAVERSDHACECCGQARGYIYIGPVHCDIEREPRLCPWCIADGTAAARFDVTFCLDEPLVEGGVPATVVDTVTHRTPGYLSWQLGEWQTCCNDACAFMGNPPASMIRMLDEAGRREILDALDLGWDDWHGLAEAYTSGDSAEEFYWFRCLGCGKDRFRADFS